MYNDCILQKNTDRGRLPVTIPGSSYILQYEPSLHGGWLWASPSYKQVGVSRRSMQTLNQCCEWDFGKFYSVPI